MTNDLAELQARIGSGGAPADHEETALLIKSVRTLEARLEKAEKALKRIAMRAETFVIDDSPMKPASVMVILGIACSALGDAAIAQEADHE